MTRYTPSRNYLIAGMVAFLFAGASSWFAARWPPSLIPTVLLAVSAILLLYLGLRPTIEIHPRHLRVGDRVVAWPDVLTLDRTDWISPLVVRLGLSGNRTVTLVYPGDLDSAKQLLRQLRRASVNAFIDGIPHAEFWENRDLSDPPSVEALPAPTRYPLLREEDEAEVERLYQRLKSVGHLDSKGTDEN